jgi:hypothetical protein
MRTSTIPSASAAVTNVFSEPPKRLVRNCIDDSAGQLLPSIAP